LRDVLEGQNSNTNSQDNLFLQSLKNLIAKEEPKIDDYTFQNEKLDLTQQNSSNQYSLVQPTFKT